MLNFRKLIKSFKHAIEGIYIAFRENQNLKVHSIAAIFAIIFALILEISLTDFILVLVMILLVFSAEMINAAIEEVVDLLVQEHRLQAKIAKDVSAGMVLVIAVGSLIVGAFIFIPYLIR